MRTSKIYLPLVFRLLLIGLLLYILFVSLPEALSQGVESLGIFFSVLAFMSVSFLAFSFASHWMVLNSNTVTIYYWPLYRKRLLYSDISRIDLYTETNISTFGGLGLRLAKGGIVAFANRKGPGLRITTSEGKHYAVNLRDETELRAVLGFLHAQEPALVSHVEVNN